MLLPILPIMSHQVEDKEERQNLQEKKSSEKNTQKFQS